MDYSKISHPTKLKHWQQSPGTSLHSRIQKILKIFFYMEQWQFTQRQNYIIKFLTYSLMGIKEFYSSKNGWQTVSWASVPGTGLAEKQGISPGLIVKFVWHFLLLAPASTHPAPVVFARGCNLLFFSCFTCLYDLRTLSQPGAGVKT